jgi:hypothetical protein
MVPELFSTLQNLFTLCIYLWYGKQTLSNSFMSSGKNISSNTSRTFHALRLQIAHIYNTLLGHIMERISLWSTEALLSLENAIGINEIESIIGYFQQQIENHWLIHDKVKRKQYTINYRIFMTALLNVHTI